MANEEERYIESLGRNEPVLLLCQDCRKLIRTPREIYDQLDAEWKKGKWLSEQQDLKDSRTFICGPCSVLRELPIHRGAVVVHT